MNRGAANINKDLLIFVTRFSAVLMQDSLGQLIEIAAQRGKMRPKTGYSEELQKILLWPLRKLRALVVHNPEGVLAQTLCFLEPAARRGVAS